MDVKRFLRLSIGAAWVLIFTISIIPLHNVDGDIGWPPVNPSGSTVGVEPGQETNVRMVAEEVNLTIEEYQRTAPAGVDDSPAGWMRGLVDAEFLMRNLGPEQENFDVWFPLASSVRYPDLLVWQPENIVADFKVWINGEVVEYQRVNAPDVGNPQTESAWARFPMIFPSGEDVVVRVSYTIFPSGRRPFGGFEFILQTGAGWKGTIGKAAITVTLPDPVTAVNVSLSGKSIEGLPIQPQPAGYEINRNTITWELLDFEPTAKDNIYVDVLEPGCYRDLQIARARVGRSPSSVDAQLELAAAVENSILLVKSVSQHGGGPQLATRVNLAYQRAIELSPDRADIYVKYANWLMRSGGAWNLFRGFGCSEELCGLVQRGLEKFPNNPELLKIHDSIQSMLAEHAGYATEAAENQTSTAQAYPRAATLQVIQTSRAIASQTPKPVTATAAARVASAIPSQEAPSVDMPETDVAKDNFWEFSASIFGFVLLAALLLLGFRGVYRK